MNEEMNNNTPETAEEEQPKFVKPEFPPVTEEYAPLADAVGAEVKQSRKFKLLVILMILAALLGIYLLFAGKLSFYERTLRHIGFDYRDGEIIGESVNPDTSIAEQLAEQFQGKSIAFRTVRYSMYNDRTMTNSVSEYDITLSANGGSSTQRTGLANRLLTQKEQILDENGSIKEKTLFKWHDVADLSIPCLDVLFFAVDQTDSYIAQLDSSSSSVINGETYQCEIWLVEILDQAAPVYFTTYRYYTDGQLAGVRVLNSNSEIMDIYDIKDYAFQ